MAISTVMITVTKRIVMMSSIWKETSVVTLTLPVHQETSVFTNHGSVMATSIAWMAVMKDQIVSFYRYKLFEIHMNLFR